MRAECSASAGTALDGARRLLYDETWSTGWSSRLEDRIHSLDGLLQDNQAATQRAHAELERAHQQAEQPFPQAEALEQARTRATELDAMLQETALRDEMTPAQRAVRGLADRARELVDSSQDATYGGRVMQAVATADGNPEMEAAYRSAHDLLISHTRTIPPRRLAPAWRHP